MFLAVALVQVCIQLSFAAPAQPGCATTVHCEADDYRQSADHSQQRQRSQRRAAFLQARLLKRRLQLARQLIWARSAQLNCNQTRPSNLILTTPAMCASKSCAAA